METLKIIGSIILGLIGVWIIIMLIFYIYTFVKCAILLNKTEKLIESHIDSNNGLIYFEYKGDSGIGKIYNNSSEDNPFYMVCCIYFKTNATQHVELKKLDNYIPVKITKITDQTNENIGQELNLN